MCVQYVMKDIMEIPVINSVSHSVKNVIYLMDHVLNVRMAFMEVNV